MHPLIYFCFYFTEKRRREETTSDVYSSLYPSSAEDLATMVTSNHEESSFQCSSRHRSGSDLTSIKPKATKQDTLPSAAGKSKTDGRSSTSQGLMSPFRTFILNEEDSLFDSDPSAWGDISSFDKTATGKNLPLSKLTSPGTTGQFLCQDMHCMHAEYCCTVLTCFVYVIGLHAVQFGKNWMRKIPMTPCLIWQSEEFFESNYFQIGQACSPITY